MMLMVFCKGGRTLVSFRCSFSKHYAFLPIFCDEFQRSEVIGGQKCRDFREVNMTIHDPKHTYNGQLLTIKVMK